MRPIELQTVYENLLYQFEQIYHYRVPKEANSMPDKTSLGRKLVFNISFSSPFFNLVLLLACKRTSSLHDEVLVNWICRSFEFWGQPELRDRKAKVL